MHQALAGCATVLIPVAIYHHDCRVYLLDVVSLTSSPLLCIGTA